jgi:hypothetical protein
MEFQSIVNWINGAPELVSRGTLALAVVALGNKVVNIVSDRQSKAAYRLVAATHRAGVKRNTGIVLDARRADPKGNEALAARIEKMGSEELLAELQSGSITSSALLKALQTRAAETNLDLNCICAFFERAAEEAEQLDQTRSSTKPGPLHGMPVSIKECCEVEGYPSTIGLAKLCTNVAEKDCVIVQVLKAAGAVPFCHTNIPQTMLSYECTNPVYGATVNPHDTTRGPGGSSGGEGAVLGAGGSVLGIGKQPATEPGSTAGR